MNISNESLLKILAVAAVAYFLLSGSSTKPKPEKFMYGDNDLGAVPPNYTSYIRKRQVCPGPECPGPFHIRTRQGFTSSNDTVNAHIRTNPMGNIMQSQHIGHHIRRDRRNNMLNSMMRGETDPMDAGSSI